MILGVLLFGRSGSEGFSLGITPHFLQPVELAGFGLHHMNNYVYIVDQDPVRTLLSFMPVRQLAQNVFYMGLRIVGNRFYLRLAAGFTNQEKIGHGFRYPAQIHQKDIFTFLFLDRVNEGLQDFCVLIQPRYTAAFAPGG